MRKIVSLFLILITLTSCYFGANESGGKITDDFYLIGWDQRDWHIVYSLNDKIYEPEKIIVQHDVFAIGNNKDFIIAKQHPCANTLPHLIDFDSLKPNKTVTNYYIIKIMEGNNNYELHKFGNENDFIKGRTNLGVPENLGYRFIDKNLK
ncbi:DUF3997 domain-containing protein [Mangrovimonas sp. TPBH4]|uniref:DUF3997 domain-containing protein n=1 Tax=Mangrovimonas sp. TPBH4 TaxID=1645914 RepID=UPI0006B67B51|nr:DUF3997 domain-containing protein [Mangrovimonas sp. TPBH4]